MAVSPRIVLSGQNIEKTYLEGKTPLTIFSNLQFELFSSEFVAIVGSSGAGKTTLLNILGGLDKPTSGDVLIGGQNVHRLAERKRCQLRNREIGFVYQFHHLLPEFSALENVVMPVLVGKSMNLKTGRAKAQELLERVGLSERLHHKPAQLSGGERQRVAIARALVNDPSCVLMDEPTGNLDEHTALEVQALMQELIGQFTTSFVVVTHDLHLAKTADRIFRLETGVLKATDKSSF
ncbi:MAG: ATP-binding cassette domain-containing protein [Pseudomonadales bacterium]|uniref:Lipoprotein transporter ATP-binding subunit n=1 Tax=Oleiphilus messinensis TaxID=141451 RepID=A0A1Y0I9N9_9GAMM|nr:ATP-binding cassette domain-containing protein [Oleiphilus messinensis]ARU56144.1 lipoprotein transporter ATP-binding subunit [Oleiphilus messinensis]MCG8612479.1 ATP-binding cassette domain-containing protein [Pseudomonadales bacterium]